MSYQINEAIRLARDILYEKHGYGREQLDYETMFVVWYCKTLQNWKALVSGEHVDHYVEITYDGDTKTTYVDVYKKESNTCIKDKDNLIKVYG